MGVGQCWSAWSKYVVVRLSLPSGILLMLCADSCDIECGPKGV